MEEPNNTDSSVRFQEAATLENGANNVSTPGSGLSDDDTSVIAVDISITGERTERRCAKSDENSPVDPVKSFSDSLPPMGSSHLRILIVNMPLQLSESIKTERKRENWFMRTPPQMPERRKRFIGNKNRAFHIWHLTNLWSPENTEPFLVQTNVQAFRQDPENQDRTGCSEFMSRQRMRFGHDDDDHLKFFEYVSSIHVQHQSDNKLQVTLRCPELPGLPPESRCQSLKEQFRKLLLSSKSTSSIPLCTAEASSMAVLIDIIRAVVETFAAFVSGIMEEFSTKLGWEEVPQFRLHNSPHLKTLAKIPRDARKAFQHTYDLLLAHIQEHIDDRKAAADEEATQYPPQRGHQPEITEARLNAVKLDFEAKVEMLQNQVNDFIGGLDAQATVRAQLYNEAQAESTARLTTLATIFLPLSLASSLLSMSTRVIDLGVLWYDYFGISLSLFSIVFLLYVLMSWWDRYPSSWKGHWQPLRWPIVSFLWEGLRFLHHYRPQLSFIAVRRFLDCMFVAMALASFWVGMVYDVHLGLLLLGYGTASFLATLLVLLLTQLVYFIYSRPHEVRMALTFFLWNVVLKILLDVMIVILWLVLRKKFSKRQRG
ncbi:hypothetical protein N656DRAFT_70073 [Canariomyces notabilis]|uniref:Uncharacterized protein n=1 Tax=Canariomyces notabilis TaxID=2074819 RepID=A0AAN6TDX5_9PEZI|nr:hypothetical protein N656DRAFT_70073 [Canariomyces arenarius]